MRITKGVHTFFILYFSSVILLLFASQASAQVTVVKDDDNDLTTYRMIVSPAAEPEPAFKYRLLKHESDRKEGNAAPFYYRAHMDSLNEIRKKIVKEYGEEYYGWNNVSRTPLAQFPITKAKHALTFFPENMMRNLREATSRSYCDWGWNLKDLRGTDVYTMWLDEIQESRSLSRMLSLRTRLALAESRLDDALEFIHMNYQLSRDSAQEPLIVCGLIGMAISGMANSQVLEVISLPESPNLYWALAELPKPIVDVRQAARFELGLGFRLLPLLKDAETKDRTTGQWAQDSGNAYVELLTNLRNFADGRGVVSPLNSRLIGVGWGLMGYTMAKQELIKGGMKPKEVEAMPVGQVLAIQASRAYRHIADAEEKLWYVPFAELRKRSKVMEQQLRREGYREGGIGSKEIIPIASLLLPAVASARVAQERLTRSMAAMQLIEALRMHAAEEGRFPKSLDEVTIVPVPLNSATHKPFVYKLEGETAVIDLPKSDGIVSTYRYELTLREP